MAKQIDWNSKLIQAVEPRGGGSNDDVREALVHGADPNTRNKLGSTALMWVAVGGLPETVEMLLRAGADVNARSNGHTTALFYSRPHTAALLLEAGADVNVSCNKGNTALIVAASRYPNPVMISMLLTAGADAGAMDNNGYTALVLAVRNGRTEIANLLRTSTAWVEQNPVPMEFFRGVCSALSMDGSYPLWEGTEKNFRVTAGIEYPASLEEKNFTINLHVYGKNNAAQLAATIAEWCGKDDVREKATPIQEIKLVADDENPNHMMVRLSHPKDDFANLGMSKLYMMQDWIMENYDFMKKRFDLCERTHGLAYIGVRDESKPVIKVLTESLDVVMAARRMPEGSGLEVISPGEDNYPGFCMAWRPDAPPTCITGGGIEKFLEFLQQKESRGRGR